MDTNDPVVQFEVTKERLKNSEEKCFHLEESLKNAHVTIERLQANLKQESEEKSDIKVNFEVTKQKLLYTEQALNQSNQATIGKSRQSKVGAAITSVIFLMASILNGFGIGMVLSTPPNTFGWALIILASVIYILATFQANLLA